MHAAFTLRDAPYGASQSIYVNISLSCVTRLPSNSEWTVIDKCTNQIAASVDNNKGFLHTQWCLAQTAAVPRRRPPVLVSRAYAAGYVRIGRKSQAATLPASFGETAVTQNHVQEPVHIPVVMEPTFPAGPPVRSGALGYNENHTTSA